MSDEDLLVADVCTSCGALVEDWEAHRRHHADLGVLATAVQRLADRCGQTNRLTLGRGLTLQGGIPAAAPDWWRQSAPA